jgi:hypothetical protein
VDSAPGRGTAIRLRVPLDRGARWPRPFGGHKTPHKDAGNGAPFRRMLRGPEQ